MCFSAMTIQELRELEREYEAAIGWVDFTDLFERRLIGDIKVSKALELNFEEPRTPEQKRIKAAIDAYRLQQTSKLEQELFKQKTRLGDAERTLKTKTTKKALADQRISTDKIDTLKRRIADVNRTELIERDSRIFPFYYAPIIVSDGKQKRIIPSRYHCRPAGKPAFFDRKFDGLYNARRDSLEKFWKEQFGSHHALMVVTSFFENVSLHRYQGRELRADEKEENLVLHFNPRTGQRMEVACLWSKWSSPDEPDLCSFAAITDEPPEEIAAAGHDRVIIALKHENVDAWLSPQGLDSSALYKMFDDRDRPYFEHRKAA